MKNRKTVTSRKKRRAITAATWPLCAPRAKARWRCWVRRLLRSKLITTRATENTTCSRWLRAWKIVRSPASKLSTCARIFKQTHQASPISSALHAGIQECLAAETQALVLINRRGYSWSVLCRSCGASRAVRELQHLDDVSQEPQPPGMPLLRLAPTGAEAVPEMPVEIRLFLRRRLGASRGTTAQGVSRRANRAARSRHRANQAPVSGNARRFCRRSPRHFGWHANARQRPRFSARHAGRRNHRGFFAEHARIFAPRSAPSNC